MSASSTFLAVNGSGYELQMGRWSIRLAPKLIAFAGVTTGSVLDVGCGTGSLSLSLAREPGIAAIHGVDLSDAYIAFARERTHDPRVSFGIADACALPLADGSFDHALSLLVLQFIPDSAAAVAQMRRVTRRGGTVAAATWDTRGGFVAYRMLYDTAAMIDQGGALRRARMFTRPLTRPGELAAAWSKAGLLDVRDDMATIRMDFASFADYWAPAEGQDGPIAEYVATLDAKTKARLRAAVEAAYLDGEVDGPRSYATTAWMVKGIAP